MKYLFWVILLFVAILSCIATFQLPTIFDLFVLPLAVTGAFFLGQYKVWMQ